MKLLTLEQLEQCIPEASDRKRIKYITPLNEALTKYNINTPLRIAAFIAQIAHESGSLHYVEEIASGTAYEYRADLGNLEQEALDAAHRAGTTSGRFYKGRGLIQTTGFYNYKRCGESLGIDLVYNPSALTDPLYASLSSGLFWNDHNCNSLADVGSFTAITRVINGGYNGLAERKANYIRCKKVFNLI
jgi:putative chitinase